MSKHSPMASAGNTDQVHAVGHADLLAEASGPRSLTILVLRLIQMIHLNAHYLFGFASTFPKLTDRSVWVEPLATGSEVQIALEARQRLETAGISTAVVSMPCFERFDLQSTEDRSDVLGTAPKLAVEAASPFGWTRYVDSEADVVGMTGYGANAPAKDLYRHFGITADAVIDRAKAELSKVEAA